MKWYRKEMTVLFVTTSLIDEIWKKKQLEFLLPEGSNCDCWYRVKCVNKLGSVYSMLQYVQNDDLILCPCFTWFWWLYFLKVLIARFIEQTSDTEKKVALANASWFPLNECIEFFTENTIIVVERNAIDRKSPDEVESGLIRQTLLWYLERIRRC